MYVMRERTPWLRLFVGWKGGDIMAGAMQGCKYRAVHRRIEVAEKQSATVSCCSKLLFQSSLVALLPLEIENNAGEG